MGLFGKSKKELLEWQNIILSTPVNKLVMTEAQLKSHSHPIVENRIRILNDSVKLCNTTKKPDVFFSRYDTLIEQAQILARLSKFIKFEGTHPEEILRQAVDRRQIETRDFINRCLDDIELLKTSSAKAKRYQKLLMDFYPYRSRMDEDNLDYLEKKCAQRIEDYSTQKKSAKPSAEVDLINELNKFILQAQSDFGIPHDLTVNIYYTIPSKTKISDEPLTKTGRVPKYPKKFHYETPEEGIWSFGDIWLLPDGSIGKANSVSWVNHTGYQILLALQEGSLGISKVMTLDDARNPDGSWKIIYKA